MTDAGASDITRAAERLAARLPPALAPLARVAYDYGWTWRSGATELFRAIDPHRFAQAADNPVRVLLEADPRALERLAADPSFVERARAVAATLQEDRARPAAGSPVAFLCTEFAIHRSLPVYSGGLAVLAGDILKEASDRALPFVGVGLFYRQGYFRQRVDHAGWQHEYWVDEPGDRLPVALVTDGEGAPVTVTTSIYGSDVRARIWRADVGRVPLFLLDADVPQNTLVDRWITSRLYIGDRRIRLAQYVLAGIGGVRALHALGIEPVVWHLNEGHVAFAPLEVARATGLGFAEAIAAARDHTMFTTHTPIAAGNEAYTGAEIAEAIGPLPEQLGADVKDVLALGRARPGDDHEPFGLTPLGIRLARTTNGVSAIHGRVARAMWRHLFGDARDDDEVPIASVTNGVHLPTWMGAPMRALLTRHLGEGWEARAADPRTWDAVEAIPDEELWAVRNEQRARLIASARERAVGDRLARGEPIPYAQAALRSFDPDALTVGFARRAAGYKRLYLFTHDAARLLSLLEGPRSLQLLLAGKAHPQDDEGKRMVQRVFELKWAPHVSDRVAFLEDYDLALASHLVSGCDVWVNLPRPPLEASGTSGMKAALNGCLNLSVADGWWAEAYDGTNGWSIEARPGTDPTAQDAHDAAALYDLLEHEVAPLFYDRDAAGVPRAFVRRIKSSLRTIGPRFNATRMLDDYAALRSGPAGR